MRSQRKQDTRVGLGDEDGRRLATAMGSRCRRKETCRPKVLICRAGSFCDPTLQIGRMNMVLSNLEAVEISRGGEAPCLYRAFGTQGPVLLMSHFR